MLTSNQIVFWTIFGGIVLALLFYVISARRCKTYLLPAETGLAFVANGMTLVTIGCFMLNLGVLVFHKSFLALPNVPADATLATIRIDGNEATLFFVFLYSFIMIGAAVRRNVISLTPST